MSNQHPIHQNCFQYCIKLGQGKYGSVLINEHSNLHEQAKKLCWSHNLGSNIIEIIENDMLEELAKHKKKINISEIVKRPESGKIMRNRIHTEMNRDSPKLIKKQSINQSSTKRITLQTQISQQKVKPATKQKVLKPAKSNYFQEMHKRHQQIQQKKALSRKNSLQKIPFKPSINKLSRKIVDMKRNCENSNPKNFKCVVYQNHKQIAENLKDSVLKENKCIVKRIY